MKIIKSIPVVLVFLALIFTLMSCGGGEESSEQVSHDNYLIKANSSSSSATGSFSIEDSGSSVYWTSYKTTGGVYEPHAMYMVYHYIFNASPLLKLPLVLDDTWSGPGRYDYGWTGTSVVTSLSESVTIGSAVYNDCAKIMTTITGNGTDSNGNPVTAEQNEFVRGVRNMWFAPGVGLIKVVYSHENGTSTNISLQSYSLSETSSAFFPLSTGNQWTYQWTNGYRNTYETETYVVDSICDGECKI